MVITLIIIGDILVCGFLIAAVTYLFLLSDKKKQQETAGIPLLSDEETLRGLPQQDKAP